MSEEWKRLSNWKKIKTAYCDH